MQNFFGFIENTLIDCTAWKVSKYGIFSGPCFPVFGLNTEIYSVYLHIQSKYRRIQTRENSVFGHFSRNADFLYIFIDFHATWATDYTSNKELFYGGAPILCMSLFPSIRPSVRLSILLSIMWSQELYFFINIFISRLPDRHFSTNSTKKLQIKLMQW